MSSRPENVLTSLVNKPFLCKEQVRHCYGDADVAEISNRIKEKQQLKRMKRRRGRSLVEGGDKGCRFKEKKA